LVHWKPSATEKWALQYHVKASFKLASKIAATCNDFQNLCCKACWTPHSKERTDEAKYDHEQGMYQCSTCIRNYHRDCLMQLNCKLYHNQDARPNTDQSEEWHHCPAFQPLREATEIWHRRTEKKIWLVHWELT